MTRTMAHSQALTWARAAREADLRHRRAICHMVAASAARFYAESQIFKLPYHNSVLTGQMWVNELLSGNPRCIKDQLGMGKHVFRKFVKKLFILTNASHTRHVDLSEQFSIFLYTIVTNLSNRKVGEYFQRSGDTISKYFLVF